jgi:diaminohydroxyphosphoribosylaminopyrimidine deaminase/5-amino-6-(5-phosphoribosylamino)uracil reductase
MAAALTLAGRGLGRVWPNPAVGCVIVKNGHMVGRGWTQPGGRPHAETEALTRAGGHARGATAYISLEPCSHHGETPPCAEALIAAGITRAVFACPDPDPRVSGQGAAMLRAAGVDVVPDILRADAERLNRGFFLRVGEGRPMVTLKVAASLDGRVATASGDSKWITAEPARRLGHLLRATHDAIAVGSGTVAADNPSLTCRLPGMAGRSPVRVVFSSSGKVELSSKLVCGAGEVPTWTVMTVPASDDHRKALETAGVQVIDVGEEGGRRIDIRTALDQLAERGLTRLLLEGGSRLSTAFVRAGLVDRIAWFAAPRLLGGDGLPALGDLGIGKVAGSLELEPVDVIAVGPDILRIFDVARRAQAEG